MGVPVLYELGDDFDLMIENWLDSPIKYPNIQANNVPETLQFLFDTYYD